MKKNIIILLLFFCVNTYYAQSKSKETITMKIECADKDNFVGQEEIQKCEKFIIESSSGDEYWIKGARLCASVNGTYTELVFGSKGIGDGGRVILAKLKKGKKFYVQGITVVNVRTKKEVKLTDLVYTIK